MLDVFNIAKPQGCDIQTFYGNGAGDTISQFTWTKPRGVSNVYMLLIGGGGNGTGTTGGGSGAVTVWYGSAQNVPDNLMIHPSSGSAQQTRIACRFTSASVTIILNANAATSNTGATAMTANQFAASGFFQSIAGQNGSNGTGTPSATTFLSGGSSNTGNTANYGYSIGNFAGYFFMQPIIVGLGGAGGNRGGIGCGGGSAVSGIGGPGMVLIASW